MPRGPKGEKRPADLIGCAHKVFQIAVGKDQEALPSGKRQSGLAGAAARSHSLSKEERRNIAALAARERWKEKK